MSILQGVYLPNGVSIGYFEDWCGVTTAVRNNFTSMLSVDADDWMDRAYAQYKYNHVPMLTLEPQYSGQSTPNNIASQIANGKRNNVVNQYADAIQNYVNTNSGPDRRAFIRIAHEMNGDWYKWSGNPSAYRDMWRKIRGEIVTRDGVDGSDVQFVFCANGDDTSNEDMEDYYPGNDVVDWVAVDAYNFGSKRNWSRWESAESLFDNMINRLRNVSNGKPVMIPETATTAEKNGNINHDAKDRWIHNAFDYFDRKNVKAVCWFEIDKEADWRVSNKDRRGYGSYINEVRKPRVVGTPTGERVLSDRHFYGNG